MTTFIRKEIAALDARHVHEFTLCGRVWVCEFDDFTMKHYIDMINVEVARLTAIRRDKMSFDDLKKISDEINFAEISFVLGILKDKSTKVTTDGRFLRFLNFITRGLSVKYAFISQISNISKDSPAVQHKIYSIFVESLVGQLPENEKKK